jgi:hypothetical protein
MSPGLGGEVSDASPAVYLANFLLSENVVNRSQDLGKRGINKNDRRLGEGQAVNLGFDLEGRVEEDGNSSEEVGCNKRHYPA